MTGFGDELPQDEVLAGIAALAEQLSEHPDVGREVLELLDWVDAFHREGLGRLVEMIRAWRGEIFLEAVAADVVAGGLLAAYDLGEGARESAEAAVDRAMAEIRPLAASHGGDIEVIGIHDGVVEVRMRGTCDGCPSSAATLTHGVEEALRRQWVSFRRLDLAEAATVDSAKADLICPVPETPPIAISEAVRSQRVQIRGHELA